MSNFLFYFYLFLVYACELIQKNDVVSVLLVFGQINYSSYIFRGSDFNLPSFKIIQYPNFHFNQTFYFVY